MNLLRDRFDYDPPTILRAWTAAAFTGCFIVFMTLFPFAGVSSGHSWETVVGDNAFILETVWCIASYFAAALFAWVLGGHLRYFVPAWLIVSGCGSILFVFTFWGYAHWDSVQRYNPTSIFMSSAPPTLTDTMEWAIFFAILYLVLTGFASFLTSIAFQDRDDVGALHLND